MPSGRRWGRRRDAALAAQALVEPSVIAPPQVVFFSRLELKFLPRFLPLRPVSNRFGVPIRKRRRLAIEWRTGTSSPLIHLCGFGVDSFRRDGGLRASGRGVLECGAELCCLATAIPSRLAGQDSSIDANSRCEFAQICVCKAHLQLVRNQGIGGAEKSC